MTKDEYLEYIKNAQNSTIKKKNLSLERRMELEESTYLTSGSTTKPQLSRQYGTGTKTEI